MTGKVPDSVLDASMILASIGAGSEHSRPRLTVLLGQRDTRRTMQHGCTSCRIHGTTAAGETVAVIGAGLRACEPYLDGGMARAISAAQAVCWTSTGLLFSSSSSPGVRAATHPFSTASTLRSRKAWRPVT